MNLAGELRIPRWGYGRSNMLPQAALSLRASNLSSRTLGGPAIGTLVLAGPDCVLELPNQAVVAWGSEVSLPQEVLVQLQ